MPFLLVQEIFSRKGANLRFAVLKNYNLCYNINLLSKVKLMETRSLYLTVFALWLAHFFIDVMIGFWPVYKTIAGLDLAIAGLISAACALFGEGMQVIFGPLCDRGYRKHLVFLGLGAAVASTFLAYTTDYGFLFLLFLITCFGSGAFHPAAISWVGSLTANRKGVFITFFAMGGAVGMACSQLIFSTIFFDLYGHTIILAFPVIALALFFALKELKAPPQVEIVKDKPSSVAIFKSFFKRQDLRMLYFSQICSQTLLWSFLFLLPDILTSRGYNTWVSLGGGHMLFVFGGALMMVPAGSLADRFSSRTVLLVSMALSAILTYIFVFNPTLPAGMVLTLLFLIGAALGAINPVAIAFGTRLAPHHPGMISAFLMGLVWCVSEGLGQAGGGILTKFFTEDAAAKALAVLGLFYFIGIAVMLRLPKAIPTPQQHEII